MLDDCTTSLFNVHVIVRSFGFVIMVGDTMTGPSGQNVSKLFEKLHCVPQREFSIEIRNKKVKNVKKG